jgi:predicted dehydrogenase
LLAKIDAADIVAPTTYHYELCKLALRKGKHVFVEKPMADTMEQAKEILALVKESKVKFQVGHVERFNPAFLSLTTTGSTPCSLKYTGLPIQSERN